MELDLNGRAEPVKRRHLIASFISSVGTIALFVAVAAAQPTTSESEHESHHPAAQSQASPAQSSGMKGMGMMGDQGVKGGGPMMGMPMPCCPCPMIGVGMMMGGGQDSAMAAKMIQMHAEMMKANALIMERYAREMGQQK